MKYYHYFGTESEYNQARDNNYEEPWLSYTEGKGLDYNKPDYTKIPFTIAALGSGNISWALGTKTVQYSKNGGTWEAMDSETTISVVDGDEVQFKGTNTDYDSNTISSTAQFNVCRNIMSLTDGNNFKTASTINSSAFKSLFGSCSNLISAGNLKLPIMTLASDCYNSMFYNCTGLITAPELPATTLASGCYRYMFQLCSNLINGPKQLPAQTLTSSCYRSMFMGCTSLVTAPELLATGSLAPYCYAVMFDGCTKLNYVKALFTNIISTNYTQNWLRNVSSTGTFVKNINAQWDVTGAYGIPSGWTVQTASS
jgi:hypothetical protein